MLPRIALKFRLKKKTASARRVFMPWDKVNRIALIIEREAMLNKSEIDDFIRSSGKYAEVFYLETSSKQSSFADWTCFIRKDRSVLGLPKSGIERELRGKEFDLVINTCSDRNYFAAAVSTALSAPFKCAASSFYSDADLVVKRLEVPLGSYLRETLRYLLMIRS